jgi:hypothetical protein
LQLVENTALALVPFGWGVGWAEGEMAYLEEIVLGGGRLRDNVVHTVGVCTHNNRAECQHLGWAQGLSARAHGAENINGASRGGACTPTNVIESRGIARLLYAVRRLCRGEALVENRNERVDSSKVNHASASLG